MAGQDIVINQASRSYKQPWDLVWKSKGSVTAIDYGTQYYLESNLVASGPLYKFPVAGRRGWQFLRQLSSALH